MTTILNKQHDLRWGDVVRIRQNHPSFPNTTGHLTAARQLPDGTVLCDGTVHHRYCTSHITDVPLTYLHNQSRAGRRTHITRSLNKHRRSA